MNERHWFLASLIAWATWQSLGLLTAVAMVLESHSRGWPIGLATVCSVLLAGSLMYAMASSAAMLQNPQLSRPLLLTVVWLFQGLAPAFVRVWLPWEEPETGMGSPMATLLSILFLSCVSGGVGVLFGVWCIQSAKNL